MTNRNIGLGILYGLDVPTKNVGSFVIELAEYHNVSYTNNSMDQFADSVTTLAGDDVKHDPVEDLLVALKRAGKLSMQQVAQLSVNYLRENVRAKTNR